MKEEHSIQLMCMSPQWNVHLKTFSHFLCALLVILCLILPGNTADTIQTRGCASGLFLHVNPETLTRVCCITVPLPKGYEYISCEENGTPDRIEKCPEGLYQVDNTTTASEAKCTIEIECNPEENLKISNCDAQGHCIFTCICNYNKGYCGPNFYDCQSFPADCPRIWVQKDCTCKWKPTAGTSSSLGKATNKPGQKIITTPSTVSADGESKPTEKKDKTAIGEDDDDKALLSIHNNETGVVPNQKQSGLQQYEIIIIVISAVGIPACIAGLAVYCWKSKRNTEYQSVDYSDGPSDNSSGNSGGGSSSDTDKTPDSAVITQATEKVIDYSNGANNNNSSRGGGSCSSIDNRPDNAMITQLPEITGYGHNDADNDGRNGSRKRSVAIVRPQPKCTVQVHYTSASDEGHMHQISSDEQGAMRGMSMDGYSDLTWSVLDNPTVPLDEETAVLKMDNQQAQDDVTSEQQSSEGAYTEELQEQDDLTSEQQSSEGAYTEELQQVVTNNMEDGNVASYICM